MVFRNGLGSVIIHITLELFLGKEVIRTNSIKGSGQGQHRVMLSVSWVYPPVREGFSHFPLEAVDLF